MQRVLNHVKHRWQDPEHRHGAILTCVGMVMTAAIMILPLWLVTYYQSGSALGATGVAGGAGVGIGAIFRSVSRDLLRTSIGVASRTAARAVSRHWTHVLIQWVAHRLRLPPPAPRDHSNPHPIGSIIVGCIGLSLSYAAVLSLLSPEARAGILGDMDLWTASTAAAIPLLCYYIFAYSFGRLLSVRVVPRTEADGLLLQLYFSLAVSFLPLTSDAEYQGSDRRRALVAGVTLGGLFVLHLVLGMAGAAAGIPFLEHLAVLTLIQLFVLSFPFDPLDGKHIWRTSKVLWVAVWIPIALAFHYRIPRVFYELI